MAYETEMKAWIDDWDAVEAHLRGRLVFNRAFIKEDRYYIGAGGGSSAGAPIGPTFRLRKDGEHCVVTFKTKAIRNGMEFNQEREFAVDDGDEFAAFAAHIGFVNDARKVKRGLSFTDGDLHVELVEIVGLGFFLEVEFVHEDGDDDLHDQAAARIRAVLELAGVKASQIESRPYNQLLRERESGG